jgi:hypothetical protein
MAIGFPVKADYATGDVLTAAQMNDLSGTLNTVPSTIGAYAAGKNKIINGDFRINQRAFTSVTATNTYTFDRFFTRTGGDGTGTFTPQTFTPGAAPVAGYEGTNFLRIVTAGSTSASTLMCIRQHMEDVRTFAGQTITLSFWAKAASGTPKIAAQMNQLFGTGGSTQVLTPGTSAATISTSWARYSYTYTLPSISGKTIGTGSSLLVSINVSAGADFAADNNNIGIQNNTFDIWGIQIEAGSIATPFQTASGTLQGELALCMRYYQRYDFADGAVICGGQAFSPTGCYGTMIAFPVPMRVVPSSVASGATHFKAINATAGAFLTSSAVSLSTTATGLAFNSLTVATGLVAGNATTIFSNNASCNIQIGAEL